MSSLISSYIFEPVARQARRFSNAPHENTSDVDSDDGSSTERMVDEPGCSHSHVKASCDGLTTTTDCSSSMENHTQNAVQDDFEDSSNITPIAGSSACAGCSRTKHSSSLSSTLPPPPADTIATGTGPYAITSLGQAFFDRFVPLRLRGRPSANILRPDSPLCASRPGEDEHIASRGQGDEAIVDSSDVDDYSSDSGATTTRQPAEHQLTSQSALAAHSVRGGRELETEALSSSLPNPSSTMPTRSSPPRNGYRPFRRSTADARSLSRDLEALERAARTLNRSSRVQPEPPKQIPEDDGRTSLRQRIQAIWAMKAPNDEKARMMHEVMNESYYSLQPQARPRSSDSLFTAKDSSDDDEGRDTDAVKDKEATVKRQSVYVPSCPHPPFDPINPYNLCEHDYQLSLRPLPPPETPLDHARSDPMDEEDTSPTGPDLGCVHYKRNVKIQCFDCKTWWPCRLCHDDANLGHQLPRHRTENMLCMLCLSPSKADQYCDHCQVRSSYYYCDICKLWDDDSTKRIYHCPDCGICRIGEGIGKDYYHCKKCNVCIPIQHENTHRCIERATECDCPICGAYMFSSSAAINAMPCGHYMHQHCYNDFISRAYRCPICQKSVVNMELQWRKLDDAIASQPMPSKLRDTVVEVRCNDCHGKSLCRYHWLGNRCGLCDSYNTLHVKFIKQGEQAQQQQQQHQQHQHGTPAVSPNRSLEQVVGESSSSVGQRSPTLMPQRGLRYFQPDEEVDAAVAQAIAAQAGDQNNTDGNGIQGGGALDSAFALPGHAYRILADMSRNLEPFRQYLNQMHPSMLEEAERLGLVNPFNGAATEGEIDREGFWSSGDEDEDDDEDEDSDDNEFGASGEISELGRDGLDLEADDDEDEDEEEDEEEASDWEEDDDDEEEDNNRLDIFLIGHM